MGRYHSPKDYVDAARDPTTSAHELRVLARSVYDFVQLAVAEHPTTEVDVLLQLVPPQIESWHEQQLAYTLARHPHTPASALHLLATRLPAVLNRGRDHDYGLRAGVALCNHPQTPFAAIQAMLADPRVSTDFRRMLARDAMRQDVLHGLLHDPSTVVQQRARGRLATRSDPATG